MQTILSIFGATGDLAKRKLTPALYNLERKNQLDRQLMIMCVSMGDRTNETYRNEVIGFIKEFSKVKLDNKILDRFLKRIYYYRLRFEDTDEYKNLKKMMEKYSGKIYAQCKTIFYLAAPPQYFGAIAKNLAQAELVNRRTKGVSTSVVFEKPFGSDLASAIKLNNLIKKVFDESQIYRIDHYLAKELVQNIIALRFGNTVFGHLWNSQHIDHIQITAATNIVD